MGNSNTASKQWVEDKIATEFYRLKDLTVLDGADGQDAPVGSYRGKRSWRSEVIGPQRGSTRTAIQTKPRHCRGAESVSPCRTL